MSATGQSISAAAVKLTAREQQVLTCLRSNTEGSSAIHGKEWEQVCLPNAQPDGMANRSYAGVLSSLERKGLYKPAGDDVFGYVKVEEQPRYCCNTACTVAQPHTGPCVLVTP